jgi:hypothetical protein
MSSPDPGDLVNVSGAGPTVDGIVFDTPSNAKVVVAVVDPKRGPVFRTVNAEALTPRSEAGPNDQALHLLVKRTPVPVRGSARGTAAGGQGRSGHHRGAPHRTTGR